MAISKQTVTSSTTDLTYIAYYDMESNNKGQCAVTVKQDRRETIFRSIRNTADEIKPLAPVAIVDDTNANSKRLALFFNQERLVNSLLVATKSMIGKSKGGNLDYDMVTFYPVNGVLTLQVTPATATSRDVESLGFKPLELGEPEVSTEEIERKREEEARAARGKSPSSSPRDSAKSEEAAADDDADVASGATADDDADVASGATADDDADVASGATADDDADVASGATSPVTAGGGERRTDAGGGATGGGSAPAQKDKEKEAASGKSGSPPTKPATKKEPSVSGMRKAKKISDFLTRKEYEDAGIPLKRAGEEGRVPEGFTMVQTIPDPEGDRTGSEYNDPRYVFKSDVMPDNKGDYVGDSYKYNVWIDPNNIKTKADLADDNNMQYVYFEIAEDNFDERPYGVDRDRNFAGLKIYHDGSITGKKAGLTNSSFFNILYTYLELWNSYKEISTLRPAPEAPAPAPAPAPAAPGPTPEAPPASPGPGDSRPAPGPNMDIVVTPPAPGGGERKTGQTGPCCHTGVKLDLSCYQRIWQKEEYPNGVTPKDCDKIYRETAGNVPNFLRGIEKDGDEWVHYIKDKQTGNFVVVVTAGGTLLNYAQSASIKQIKIVKGGIGGFRDSAKTNDPSFNNVFRTLRTTIKDVRVFLPYDPNKGPDSCGLTDDEVFARTDWTIQLREDKQMRIIRRQIRNLLLAQRS